MKKIVSLVLSLVIVTAIFSISLAVQTSASEAPAETKDGSHVIYFDPSATGWNNYSLIMVYCYCPADGEELIPWASKKKGGMTEKDGIWSYDFDAKGITLQDGKEYSLIFNTDLGQQTHDLLFNTTMFGDTAIGSSTQCENPADSNKRSNLAYWKSGKLGPAMAITSIGNVVPEYGGVIPSHTNPQDMFVAFLADRGSHGLLNALNYQPDKTAQEMIDEVAGKLGLDVFDAGMAIKTAASPAYDRVDCYDWSKDWDASRSSLPGYFEEPTEIYYEEPTEWHGGGSGGYEWEDDYLNPYRTRIDYDSPYGSFCSYLTDGGFAADLRQYGNKTEQQLIDAKAVTLGLYRDDVELALTEVDAVNNVAWVKSKSSLKAGKSGLTYREGAVYLVAGGIENVNKNAIMEPQKVSGYYIISKFPMSAGETAQVARYDGNGRFTVLSQSPLTMPEYDSYLFFFRTANDGGYNFGFNYRYEYELHSGEASGSSSGSAGSGPVEVKVYMDEIEDEVNGVKLTWSKPDGVTPKKYRVFLRVNGAWQKLADTTSTSYIHTAAKSGETYQYTLRGIDANGKFCTSFESDGWYHRYLGAAKITGIENTAAGAQISWNAVGGNARYRVFVKDGINWETLGDTYGTTFIHPAKKVNPTKPVTPGSGTKIYFDANRSGWRNYKRIMVYCYCPETGENLNEWGSWRKGGMTDEGNGIWSYDFAEKGINIDPSKQYVLIFNTDVGHETCYLLFDTSCYGDTAIPEADNYCENPVDSNKKSTIVRWKSGKLGPMLCITSIGNVVGEVVPAYTTAYDMFVRFLASDGYDGLSSALNYNWGMDAQGMIDRTASYLGLSLGEVEKAIKQAADGCYISGYGWCSHDWRYDWSKDKSSLSGSSGFSSDLYVEDGMTYRYMVRCVSYDGTAYVGAYDDSSVSNQYIKPEEPTEPPTDPPTEPAHVYMRGDYDLDNDITIMDATRAQNMIADLCARLEPEVLSQIDADGDHELTIMDATRVQNVLAELMTMDGVKLV